MTTLTAVVGPKGANLSHDVTLVQAMLQAIAQPSGRRYYDAKYDGIFGPITAAAIVAFQTDRGISGPGFGTVNMAPPPGNNCFRHCRPTAKACA